MRGASLASTARGPDVMHISMAKCVGTFRIHIYTAPVIRGLAYSSLGMVRYVGAPPPQPRCQSQGLRT